MPGSLTNTAVLSGTFNGVATGLTQAVTVQTVTELTMTKTANKQSWADGYLTYTITVTNADAANDYTDVKITDQLDASIDLVVDSVTINSSPATIDTDYTYASNLLTFGTDSNLLSVPASGNLVITFQVKRL